MLGATRVYICTLGALQICVSVSKYCNSIDSGIESINSALWSASSSRSVGSTLEQERGVSSYRGGETCCGKEVKEGAWRKRVAGGCTYFDSS